MNNYDTHNWETIRTPSTPNDPSEIVITCTDCGCENIGHPDEFPDVKYPDCNEECD